MLPRLFFDPLMHESNLSMADFVLPFLLSLSLHTHTVERLDQALSARYEAARVAPPETPAADEEGVRRDGRGIVCYLCP